MIHLITKLLFKAALRRSLELLPFSALVPVQTRSPPASQDWFMLNSVSDPHKFSAEPDPGSQKCPYRSRPSNFLFGSGSKGSKNLGRQLIPKKFQLKFSKWHKHQCFRSGWIRVFSPIRIRFLKVRIRPLINLSDLNDDFDKVLEEPDQKRQC